MAPWNRAASNLESSNRKEMVNSWQLFHRNSQGEELLHSLLRVQMNAEHLKQKASTMLRVGNSATCSCAPVERVAQRLPRRLGTLLRVQLAKAVDVEGRDRRRKNAVAPGQQVRQNGGLGRREAEQLPRLAGGLKRRVTALDRF